MGRPPIPWTRACWGAFALAVLFTAQNSLVGGSNPREWNLPQVFFNQLIVWGLWLAALPLILAVARRWRGGRRRTAAVLEQVFIAVAVAVAHSASAGVLRWATGISISPRLDVVVAASIAPAFAINILRYALIATACHAFLYHHDVREQDARAARLEASTVEAQLDSLRARLQPHFLFNTLNSIGALVDRDPAAAHTMLEQLAELLRAALGTDGRWEIPLDDELALVEQYGAIQRMRFQDRLDLRVEIPAALRRALVPQLILQPLVENAIRHGIAPLERGGHVLVGAEADGATLRLWVDNDGVTPPKDARAVAKGFGVSGTEARLAHLYGPRARFSFGPVEPRGARAVVELPLRLADGPAHA
jgi:signal transduction histidine kinase